MTIKSVSLQYSLSGTVSLSRTNRTTLAPCFVVAKSSLATGGAGTSSPGAAVTGSSGHMTFTVTVAVSECTFEASATVYVNSSGPQ